MYERKTSKNYSIGMQSTRTTSLRYPVMTRNYLVILMHQQWLKIKNSKKYTLALDIIYTTKFTFRKFCSIVNNRPKSSKSTSIFQIFFIDFVVSKPVIIFAAPLYARVAQLVEHQLPKLRVASSNLVSRSI